MYLGRDARVRAKTTYIRLTQERDDYTQRAEKCATYTIPKAFPGI